MSGKPLESLSGESLERGSSRTQRPSVLTCPYSTEPPLHRSQFSQVPFPIFLRRGSAEHRLSRHHHHVFPLTHAKQLTSSTAQKPPAAQSLPGPVGFAWFYYHFTVAPVPACSQGRAMHSAPAAHSAEAPRRDQQEQEQNPGDTTQGHQQRSTTSQTVPQSVSVTITQSQPGLG